MLRDLCEKGVLTWNKSKRAISVFDLQAYYKASILVSPLPPMPDLSAIWDETVRKLEKCLEDGSTLILDFDPVSDFASVLRIISIAEPRFLKQRDFPTALSALLEKLLRRIIRETGTPFGDDADALEYEAGSVGSLRWTIEEVGDLMNADRKILDSVCENLEAHQAECEKQRKIRARYAPPGEDEDLDEWKSADDPIDVDALFSDL